MGHTGDTTRLGLLLTAGLSIFAVPAQAQNRGVYPLGMSATNSGVTPQPGFTYVNQLLFYSRDHARDDAGNTLPVAGENTFSDLIPWPGARRMFWWRPLLCHRNLRREEQPYFNVAGESVEVGFADHFCRDPQLALGTGRGPSHVRFSRAYGRFEAVRVTTRLRYWRTPVFRTDLLSDRQQAPDSGRLSDVRASHYPGRHRDSSGRHIRSRLLAYGIASCVPGRTASNGRRRLRAAANHRQDWTDSFAVGLRGTLCRQRDWPRCKLGLSQAQGECGPKILQGI